MYLPSSGFWACPKPSSSCRKEPFRVGGARCEPELALRVQYLGTLPFLEFLLSASCRARLMLGALRVSNNREDTVRAVLTEGGVETALPSPLNACCPLRVHWAYVPLKYRPAPYGVNTCHSTQTQSNLPALECFISRLPAPKTHVRRPGNYLEKEKTLPRCAPLLLGRKTEENMDSRHDESL